MKCFQKKPQQNCYSPFVGNNMSKYSRTQNHATINRYTCRR